MSVKRHSKSTFDRGFESGLSDILDEILGGGGNYDPVLEEALVSESPRSAFIIFPRLLTFLCCRSSMRIFQFVLITE
jgi:hypothetical protein